MAGVALGVAARRKIARTGERGAALAVAAIIIGVITLLFAIGYWAFVAMHLGGGHGGGSDGGGYGAFHHREPMHALITVAATMARSCGSRTS